MKKIAIWLNTYPRMGGEHQYATLLVECLRDKFDILPICSTDYWVQWCKKNGLDYVELPGYYCHQYHMFMLRLLPKSMVKIVREICAEKTKIGKALKGKDISVVLYAQQGNALFPLPYVSVFVVHDLMHRYEKKFPEVKNDYVFRENRYRYFAKYCDGIITDSELGKKQFLESYQKYASCDLLVNSLPFIAPPHIRNQEAEAIDVPLKYVFYPAQFWKHKNHINLVKAIGLLKEKIEDIHLVLVGSEKNELSNIQKYIVDHQLEDYITIKGFVSDENINYLYKNATIMVMPSYFGPTNIPPLEAMALGCPVAVSNNYAMGEQVLDAGLLFSPDSPEEIADCIKKVWLDQKLRMQMIDAGYRRIKEWDKIAFMNRLEMIVNTIEGNNN